MQVIMTLASLQIRSNRDTESVKKGLQDQCSSFVHFVWLHISKRFSLLFFLKFVRALAIHNESGIRAVASQNKSAAFKVRGSEHVAESAKPWPSLKLTYWPSFTSLAGHAYPVPLGDVIRTVKRTPNLGSCGHVGKSVKYDGDLRLTRSCGR